MYKKILLKNGFQEGNEPKSQQKVTYKKKTLREEINYRLLQSEF